VNVIVERDEFGWVSRTTPTPEHEELHELAIAIGGVIHHSAAAFSIAVAGGDYRTADESAALALRLNDPKPEEDER